MTSLWIVLFGLPDLHPPCLSHTDVDFTLGAIQQLSGICKVLNMKVGLLYQPQKERKTKKRGGKESKQEKKVTPCFVWAVFTKNSVGIQAWKTSVLRKYTYWDLIFDALLEEQHWWGVCLCCLCWSLAHRALWERASETWPQTFSWSPQNKTGKSWQSVRHRVVTQSVAGNQSLNSSDSSLHHTQCQYTVHKEALSSSLSVLLYLSQPLPPPVWSLMLLKNKCFSQLSLPCDLLAVFNCRAASFIVTWSGAESWQNGISVQVPLYVSKCMFRAKWGVSGGIKNLCEKRLSKCSSNPHSLLVLCKCEYTICALSFH